MVALSTNPIENEAAQPLLAGPAKSRLKWSALLLFVLGLCSLASPHLMRHAHVHHTSTRTSPASQTGRTSSRARSSTRGGVQVELDRDRLHAELSSARKSAAIQPAPVPVLAFAGVALPRIVLARSALASATEAEDPTSPSLRIARGRAPPAV